MNEPKVQYDPSGDLDRLAEDMLKDLRRGDLDSQDRLDACAVYLEIQGKRLAAGLDCSPVEEIDPDLARQAVAAMGNDCLYELADELIESIDNLTEDPFDEEFMMVFAERAENALLERQRFADRLAGARLYLEALELDQAQQDAVYYFDTLVRPMSWALSFINQRRDGHSMALSLEERRRHWWWTEAADIDWTTVAQASEVADLLERYPSFSLYFERLRRGARLRQGQSLPRIGKADHEAEVIELLTTWQNMQPRQRARFMLNPELGRRLVQYRPAAAAAAGGSGEILLHWKGEKTGWQADLRIPPPDRTTDLETVTLRLYNLPAHSKAIVFFGRRREVTPDEQGRALLEFGLTDVRAAVDVERPALCLVGEAEPRVEFGVLEV